VEETMKFSMFQSIRFKLITLCLCLLLIPSLIAGLISYGQSKSGLDHSGEVQLKNDVRLVISMITALDQQIKQGKISLEEAQEFVKKQILGEKNAQGQRPINKRFDLGEYGYMFIYDQKGIGLRV
jgi:methyl-accepting chemotaxis protein